MSKIKNLILMLAVSLMLSGCGENKPVSIDETQSVSEDSAVSENASVAEETVLNTENQEPSDSQEEYLPEGFTMDDLRNMIQINGKTLTLPTSLNKLAELDENFSYEAEYVDENSYLYQGKNGFYVDVTYNDIIMFTTSFVTDVNDLNLILDSSISNVTFNRTRCDKAEIDVKTSCGLDFNSTQENVIDVFGDANIFDYSKSNIRYEFSDNKYTINMFYDIYKKDNCISSITMSIAENGSK